LASSLQLPQRLAPVETEGAAGIGPGERFQTAPGDPGTPPEREGVGIAVGAALHQLARLGFRESLHLAQPQAEREGLGDLRPGEIAAERSVVGWRGIALTLPRLRLGPLPLPLRGRGVLLLPRPL